MTDHGLIAKKNAEEVFRHQMQSCLAYQKFAKAHQIDSNTKFSQLPLTNKKNYVQKYSLESRLAEGTAISDFYMYCTSSGSTGEPTIWPRDVAYDEHLEPPHTHFLEEHFQIKKKRTLIVVAFGMGTSTAGVMHALLSWKAAKKYKISVITPGTDVSIASFLIQKLYANFDQVICIGYPPIISEIVSHAIDQKIDVKKWNCKVVFAGGSVSANWRVQLAKKLNKNGDLENIVGFYGASETGIIGFETHFINSILNACIEHPYLTTELFNSNLLPSIISVNLEKKFIEVVDDELIITVNQAVPLIRYNLEDFGALISVKKIQSVFKKYQIALPRNYGSDILVVIYGRNLQLTYTLEEIREEVEKLPFFDPTTDSFRYKEEKHDNQIILSIKVYKLRMIADQSLSLETAISNLAKKLGDKLDKKTQLEVQLLVEMHERETYHMGKIRYILS